MKFLLIAPDGKTFAVEKKKSKFSTHLGELNLAKLKVGEMKSNTGAKFKVVEATFADLLQRTKRGPAVILPKDAASIIAHSGISPGSKVVDIGTGSGWLASMLANAVGPTGKVTTYEIRKEFAQLAEKNFKFLDLKNVKVKVQDGTKGIAEKNLDLITIDLPEPWLVLPDAKKALKAGRIIVAYVPQITQAVKFVEALGADFQLGKVLEVHEREWSIETKQNITRPQHNALSHTAFLVFARCVKS